MSTDKWNGGSGAYAEGSNWSEGSQPASGEDVVISASGSDVVTDSSFDEVPNYFIQYNSLTIGSGATLDNIFFGMGVSNTFSNSGTVDISDASDNFNEAEMVLYGQNSLNSGTININGTGQIFVLSPIFENSGTINVMQSAGSPDNDTGVTYSGLVFTQTTKLTGGGDIKLSDGGDLAGVYKGDGPFGLENSDNAISGSGNLVGLFFTNDAGGIIEANGSSNLTVSTGNTVHNAGLMESTVNTGDLVLDDAVMNTGTIEGVDQGDVEVNGTVTGGTLEANAGGFLDLNGSAVSATLLATNPGNDRAGPSTLTINGTAQNCIINAAGTDEYGDFATIYIKGTIEGGTIESENQGLILSSDGTLDGTSNAVTNLDRIVIGANTSPTTMTIKGVITNAGSIILLSQGPEAYLLIGAATATLRGGGSVQLDGGVIEITESGNTLTNVNNTISGHGFVGQGGLVLKNEHVVDATGGGPLFVDLSASTSSTNAGTMEATGGGDMQLIAGLLTNSGTIVAGGDSSIEFDKSAKITNTGLVGAVHGGSVTIGGAAHNAGAFHSTGTVEALAASSVAIGLGAVSNIAGVVLTGGTWEAAGTGATLNFADGFTSDKGILVLDTTGSTIEDGGVSLELKLTDIGLHGLLSIRNGRSYTTTNALTLEGALQLVGSGTFKSGTITGAAGSLVSGTGTLASNLTTTGTVRAVGGMLTLTGTDTLHGAIIGGGMLALKGATTMAAETISGGTHVAIAGKTIASGTITLGAKSGSTTTAGLLAVSAGGVLDLSGAVSIALVSGSLGNAGTSEKTGTGTGKVGVTLANSGTLLADGGLFDLAGAVSGTGKATIEGGGTLEFDAAVASTQALSFSTGGGKLLLDDAAGFAGSIASLGAGDTLDIGHFGKGTTATYKANGKNTGGTLTIKTGGTAANLTLVGVYAPTGFHLTTGSAGDTLVTYAAPKTSASHADAFTAALFDAAFGQAPNANVMDVAAAHALSHAAMLAASELHSVKTLG